MSNKKTIIYGNGEEVWFFDECGDYEVDDFKKQTDFKVFGMFADYAKIFHPYTKSEIWDDMTGYIDEVNEEIYSLDENKKYTVCWFKCDDNYELRSFVDMNISKQDIINNINSQKYREGANIFPAIELVPLA